MGIEAQRILRDGPIGVWSPSALGQPAGPFYWTAAVFLFVEPGIVSVRLSMALLGIATVPAAYLFFRVLFGPRVAFLSAALLAVGFWHLTYSRVAFPPVALPLVELLAFTGLFVAFERDTLPAYLMAGALLGLGIYTYIPYPFLAAGVALFVIGWTVAEIKGGKPVRDAILRLSVLTIGGVLTAGPFLLFLAQHPEPYQGYGGSTLIPMMRISGDEKLELLLRRLTEVPTVFFRERPIDFTDGMGAQPLLDFMTGVMFLVGIGLALRRFRDKRYLFILVTLVAGLSPAVLSGLNWGENRRLVGALPAVYLLAGLAFAETLGFVRDRLPRRSRELYASAAVVMVFIAGLNVRTYFGEFARRGETRWVYAEEIAAACEMLAAREDATYVYFYAGRWTYKYETCRFLVPDLAAEDRSREFGNFSLEKSRPGPVTYVLLPPYADLADQVERKYPGGVRAEGRADDGRLLYVAYETP